MQKTCVLIKPDAMRSRVCGKIFSRFEEKNLKIIGCKLIKLNDILLTEHYIHVSKEDFFTDLKKFMKSAPVMVVVLKGKNAVEIVRKMSGKNYKDSGTIRGEFATSFQQNAIHSSDSIENAEKEISRFFLDEEIF